MASQNLASQLTGTQIIELVDRLGRFGLTPERVAKLAGDDKMTKEWVGKLDEAPDREAMAREREEKGRKALAAIALATYGW